MILKISVILMTKNSYVLTKRILVIKASKTKTIRARLEVSKMTNKNMNLSHLPSKEKVMSMNTMNLTLMTKS